MPQEEVTGASKVTALFRVPELVGAVFGAMAQRQGQDKGKAATHISEPWLEPLSFAGLLGSIESV